MLYILALIMFICGLLVFSFNFDHFLVTLMSLEYIVLSLFWIIYLYMLFNTFDLIIVMVMLTLWVCEAVLGLSILISLIRGYGNDYFFSFNIIQC
uniref:NADH dehydrogenase subunit 4L n=1 Tax=Carausius morosus TaxID=7022 RepID=UPI0030035F8C|nr:NADH dehydrogenase subunit 4L [Carausius morosus]